MNNTNNFLTRAFILAAILLIISLLPILLNDFESKIFGYLSPAIIIIAGVVFCLLKGKESNSSLKYGKLFANGFNTILVGTIISTLLYLGLVYFVFPDTPQLVQDAQNKVFMKEAIEKKLSPEQIDASLKFLGNTSKYFYIFVLASGIIGGAFLGCIGSLIGAAVTSKKNADKMEFSA